MFIQFDDGAWLEYNILEGRLNLLPSTTMKIDMISVHGEELDYIREIVTNIPDCPKAKSLRYFGDHAKFIAGNL